MTKSSITNHNFKDLIEIIYKYIKIAALHESSYICKGVHDTNYYL